MGAALRGDWWRDAVAALLLLGIGIGLVLLFYLSSGAEFVAGALTQLLGRRVEIGDLEIRLGRDVEVDLTHVRVFDAMDAEQDGIPTLELRHARGRQSWPRLLAGQFVPLEWTLEEPLLRLPAQGSGSPRLRTQLPLLKLTVTNGTLEWPQAEGAPILVRDIQLSAWRSALRTGLDGDVTAELTRDGRGIGWLGLVFEDLTGDVSINGKFRDLDFVSLPMLKLPPASGRASGRVVLQVVDDVIEGTLDAGITLFTVDIPKLKQPLTPKEVRIQTDGRWEDGVLTLYPRPIRFDDLSVSGELHITTGPNPRVRGTLLLDPFQLGRPDERLQLLRLMGLRHMTWLRVDQRAEDGWVDHLELELDVPLRELDQVLAFKRKLRPKELTLTVRIRDAVYRPSPDSQPLEKISLDARIRGNVLELDLLRMERGGKPLPQVSLLVDGMHRLAHLPVDERGTPPGPGVPIPGLGPAFTKLAEREDGERPAFEAQLYDFQIGYPAFVLPLRDINGRLRFPHGDVAIENAQGVVGGAPARVSARWYRAQNRVTAEIVYADYEAAPRVASNGSWAEGRFTFESLYFGRWLIEGGSGHLRAQAAQLRISDVDGQLGHGDLKGRGSVSLAQEGRAPFDFDLEVAGADAYVIQSYVGMSEGTVTGRMFGKGTLAGELEPGRPFLEKAQIAMNVRLEDGTLERLPATIALARLPSLTGVGALFGQPLPYDTLTAQLTIEKGVLRTDDYSLQGPELRMLAAGQINLLSNELQTDMTVALLFLQTVDWMIEKLGPVGDFILGEDKSLVTLYIRLDGPWRDPRARLVTPKLIDRGVARLKQLFSIGQSTPQTDTDENSSQDKDQ